MNPVRGIETALTTNRQAKPLAFKLMNPVRGIETFPKIWAFFGETWNFQINESRSRDWNGYAKFIWKENHFPFKLMNPVRGIETYSKSKP